MTTRDARALRDIAGARAGRRTAALRAAVSPTRRRPRFEFKSGAASRAAAADWLLNSDPTGGQDNVATLVRAVDLAARASGSVIVGFTRHFRCCSRAQTRPAAPQWQPTGPAILDFQTSVGLNRITEQPTKHRRAAVPRSGDVLATPGACRLGDKSAKSHAIVRKQVGSRAAEYARCLPSRPALGAKVVACSAAKDGGGARPGWSLSTRHTLSGAVVLETRAVRHRLQPVDAETVPRSRAKDVGFDAC